MFVNCYFCRTLTGLYIALGLSGVIPCVHYIFLEGFWDTVGSPEVGWLFLMAFLYISGAIIYALRIPESLYPGKFDIWVSAYRLFSSRTIRIVLPFTSFFSAL